MNRLKEQVFRFGRVFVFALLPQITLLGGRHVDRTIAASVVIGALETAFRQLYPPVARTSAPDAPDTPAVQ